MDERRLLKCLLSVLCIYWLDMSRASAFNIHRFSLYFHKLFVLLLGHSRQEIYLYLRQRSMRCNFPFRAAFQAFPFRFAQDHFILNLKVDIVLTTCIYLLCSGNVQIGADYFARWAEILCRLVQNVSKGISDYHVLGEGASILTFDSNFF